MKIIGKILCCISAVMLLILMMLVYLIHPYLLINGNYAVLFIMIILECSLFYTQLILVSGISCFFTLAAVEAVYSRVMERIGIE